MMDKLTELLNDKGIVKTLLKRLAGVQAVAVGSSSVNVYVKNEEVKTEALSLLKSSHIQSPIIFLLPK